VLVTQRGFVRFEWINSSPAIDRDQPALSGIKDAQCSTTTTERDACKGWDTTKPGDAELQAQIDCFLGDVK
jgi:hypothetical protein